MMKKQLSIVFLLLILFGCGPEKYFKTKSGVVVEYLEHGDGPALKNDSILVIYIKQRTISDRVLRHSHPLNPMALRFSKNDSSGHLADVLKEMIVGDSVYFETTAQNLYEETYKMQIPPNFTPNSTIKIDLKVAYQFNDSTHLIFVEKVNRKIDSVNERKEILFLEQLIKTDGDSIDNYLQKQGIKAEITASGLRYQITNKGNGDKIEIGDVVLINYSAAIFLDDNFVSLEKEINVGIGSVIAGLDEGLTYLSKGDNAIFYIPSPLAYGSQSPNSTIPPYSIMVFDVEVVDVKKK